MHEPVARPRLAAAIAVIAALCTWECAPSHRAGEDAGTDAPWDGSVDVPDEDGDGISDEDEGRAESIDWDNDGTPDYLDEDSDGDGIADSVEAGNGNDPRNPPADSDDDGTPDFRDIDSDANGIFDSSEGSGDADDDGTPDFADWDNDGDLLDDTVEIGDDPSLPRDSDGDDVPDFFDPDSDNDVISDREEMDLDTDRDDVPDYLDDDSDGDTLPDSVEAGDDDLSTPPYDTDDDGIFDFRDPDSDNDGLSDRLEAESGTSPTDSDSDDDGVNDTIEVAAGTDPLDPDENPRANGDFVFMVPYNGDPDPENDTLSFSTDIQFADVYFLVDTTGSMGGAIGSLQAALTDTIIPNIAAMFEEVYFGVGRFRDYPYAGYGGSGDVPYQHLQSMTDSVADAQAAVDTMAAGGGADGAESQIPALHAVATGCGDGWIADDTACADPALIGYPHFRNAAVPIVILCTDAPFHNGPVAANDYNPASLPGITAPTYAQTIDALNAIHARVISINSASYDYGGRADMLQLARDTGTMPGGVEAVYDQYGTDFASLVVSAVGEVSSQVPMDISAVAVDDTTDDVDATIFIERIEPAVEAPEPCASGLTVSGDTFVDVLPGTTVCFIIHAARNTTVEPEPEPQIFMALIQVWGDSVTLLDERDVYFLVPAEIEDPGGPD